MSKHAHHGLPTRQQILDFIASSDTPAGKREIARAFALKGNEKIALKALLKDMADEGLIDSAPGRAFHKMGGLPKVTVLRVVDIDGAQVIAIPERWEAEGKPPPRLRVIECGRRSALGVGDRILARTEEQGAGYVAHPMKKLARGEEQLLGVVAREGDRWWLRAIDKRERRDTPISDLGEAGEGDLVLAEKSGRPPRITAKVVEILGDPFAPKSFSLIAIHKFGIPHVFSEDLLQEAERMAALDLGKREDLRHLPIVAIDPIDARDFDDAVWASPREDGGFDTIVAIADVAFYVRPGSALDREARKRGNSVYFPDRVVPMLPEQLSADVCSLRAGHDRAAMACHMVIDANGQMVSWRFSRAVIRVAANIPYEDAQAAIDGVKPHDLTEVALRPLWDCWALMFKAREKRGPLDLDLPERRVELDEKGRIQSVAPRERLDAHRLIEDYMIAANVAAAKALEAKKAPVMYRIHEPPSREKLVALKDYLKTFEIEFALGQVITPATFNRLIDRLGEAEFRTEVMEQILRSQTQAYYGPQNSGHFGLALGSYAHFTSPIRRYSDLIVHRALVGAYGLNPQAEATALTADDAERMKLIGELISAAERRAMEAERETVDRYVAAFLSMRVGEVVATRITGVTNFGFFATVEGLGGDGLVPISTLGTEYFRFDEAHRSLIGEETGETYRIGQHIDLRLAEANPISGALRFELPEGASHMPMPKGPRGDRKDRTRRPPMGKRGRPGNIRHQGRRK
ncbi:ribonuclease R [Chakrabartia godavariana]|nr:ribonuclease R [Chakrabartia godavariana]